MREEEGKKDRGGGSALEDLGHTLRSTTHVSFLRTRDQVFLKDDDDWAERGEGIKGFFSLPSLMRMGTSEQRELFSEFFAFHLFLLFPRFSDTFFLFSLDFSLSLVLLLSGRSR